MRLKFRMRQNELIGISREPHRSYGRSGLVFRITSP